MVGVWATNIIGSIFVIAGALLILNVVFPILRRVLDGLAGDQIIVGRGILTLLIVYVYFLAIQMIITLLKAIGNPMLNNIDLISPGVNLVVGVYDILKWVIIGLVIALAFVNQDKKKK